MICPYCDRNCGNDIICAGCGAQLRQEDLILRGKEDPFSLQTPINTKKGSSAFPVNSSYIGERKTYLDLTETSVIISPTGGYAKRTEIPYNALTTVIYMRPASGGWLKRCGVLLFRGESNKEIPIPDERKMESDGIAVLFPAEKDMLFYHVFYALKTVAPSGAKFEMVIPASSLKNLDRLSQGIDFDSFWERYAPNRERTANGISAKYGIDLRAARALIDMEFDRRQSELYGFDPLNAVRDLNYIVADLEKSGKDQVRLRTELRDARMERHLDEIRQSVGHIETMIGHKRFDNE